MDPNSENEKHDLTEEELAALADEEGGAGDEPEGGKKPVEEDENNDGEKKPAGGEGEGEKPAGDEEGSEGERGQFETNEPAPVLRARAPEDAAAKLEALDNEAGELETKFDDGDITAGEYRKALADIEKRRGAIQWETQKAELASEMQQQARDNAWSAAVKEFMTTDGADIAKSRAGMLAFDEFVKEVTADPKNAGLSDRKQLELAHKLFLEDLGALAPKPRQRSENQSGEGERQTNRNDPAPKPKRTLPPTLGKLPASDLEEPANGRYAALDRLASEDPEGYEEAVAKMTTAEVEEYANTR